MGCWTKHLGVFLALKHLWGPLTRERDTVAGPLAFCFIAQAALFPPFRVQWVQGLVTT